MKFWVNVCYWHNIAFQRLQSFRPITRASASETLREMINPSSGLSVNVDSVNRNCLPQCPPPGWLHLSLERWNQHGCSRTLAAKMVIRIALWGPVCYDSRDLGTVWGVLCWGEWGKFRGIWVHWYEGRETTVSMWMEKRPQKGEIG